jgi:hypothetical protein
MPSPAASAFWKIKSAPRWICAIACSLPALASSQLPMYEVSTFIFGSTECTPASKARKLLATGGSWVPPIIPITFDFVSEPASTPATYDGSSKPNTMGATFFPKRLPEVVM